jgi:protein-S-isoprenylcysteine O-methyltransferase Ste14
VSDGLLFRWFFAFIFVAAFAISAYLRGQARRTGEVIARTREGRRAALLRFLFATPLYLGMLAYVINPDWMAWSSIALLDWMRWSGVAVGLATLPLLYWVLRTLGRNVSETVLTKREHELVTSGPYRWVRHPLYALATVAFVSLGIVAANWFLILMPLIGVAAVRVLVIPREENELIKRFGDAYREYQRRVGRLVPRWRGIN